MGDRVLDVTPDVSPADASTPVARTAVGWFMPVVALLVVALDQLGRPIPALWPERNPDNSWMVGLQLLRDQGVPFGLDQVFTYGPWGFLTAPTGIDLSDLWFAGAFRAAAVLMLFLGIHASLSGRTWKLPVSVGLALLIGNCSQADWILVLALCAVVLAHLAAGRQPGLWMLVGGAALSALALQIKFSDGVLAISVVGLLTLVTWSARAWLISAGAFVGASAGLWLVAGQQLTDLPDWLRLSTQIVSGYGDAMAFTSTSWIVWLMLVGAGVATMVVVSAGAAPLAARVGALGIVLFATKAALTRPDGPHVLAGYTGVVLAMVVLIAATPRLVRVVAVPVAGVLALLMMVNMPILPPRQLTPDELPVDALPAEQARRSQEVRRDLVESLAIGPDVLAELQGHPVSIDPWEISAAWAYGLDWAPLPVFQGYSAYTSDLDELNTSALLADPGHRVLREPATYDAENQAWASPGSTLALLCSFEEVVTDGHWSVYARSTDRCGAERTLSSRRVLAGQSVDLPQPVDALVLLRFQPDLRPWADRLLGVAGVQRHLLHARLDGEEFRVTEGLAGGPLVVGSSEPESVLFGAEAATTVSFDRAGVLEIVEIPLTSGT